MLKEEINYAQIVNLLIKLNVLHLNVNTQSKTIKHNQNT